MSGPFDAATLGMAAILGYLLGSIPFGLILTRMAGLGDVRKIGSGNIGATNVLRTGHKGLAAATLLLDALKGTVAVLIALRWGLEASIVAGFAAFIGHCYPAWLGFNGGKGVATFVGLALAYDWRVMLIFAAIWLGVAFASRYSSLAALVATAATPLVFAAFGSVPVAILFAVLAAIAWYKHGANIGRLRAGTESRIGSG